MIPDDMLGAVERARRIYEARDADPRISNLWTCFAEDEVLHRNRQYWAFARLLSGAGLENLAALRILDVGCGTGRQLRSFVDMGATPVALDGVDISERYVERALALSPGIRIRLYNGVSLPFEDNTFDLVTQFVVFSSIPSDSLRHHLAREITRVLRPGGYMFWWDCTVTMLQPTQEPIVPEFLFRPLPTRVLKTALLPSPAECMRTPSWLRWIRRLANVFRFPPSHVAAMVGPKRGYS